MNGIFPLGEKLYGEKYSIQHKVTKASLKYTKAAKVGGGLGSAKPYMAAKAKQSSQQSNV